MPLLCTYSSLPSHTTPHPPLLCCCPHSSPHSTPPLLLLVPLTPDVQPSQHCLFSALLTLTPKPQAPPTLLVPLTPARLPLLPTPSPASISWLPCLCKHRHWDGPGL